MLRIELRIAEQGIGQRLQTGLARDLGTGATTRLVRQVEVFQQLLGLRRIDLPAQRIGEFALLCNGSQDGGATLLEFAQIGQTFFQVAQLRVVEVAGLLLAIACNERNTGTFIQQGNGGTDLLRLDRQLGGDALNDLGQCKFENSRRHRSRRHKE